MKHPLLALSLSLSCLACASGAESGKGLRDNADQPFSATGEDPTRLPTGLGFAYASGVNHETGTDTNDYLLTGSLSLLGFQLLADLPVHSRVNPGGGATRSGFGDSFVSGAFAIPFNPKMRLAFGIDATLDTSDLDALGAEETVYSPFAALALELEGDNLGLLRVSHTDASHDGVDRWEFLLRGVHRFGDQLFSSAELTPGWDDLHEEFLLNARTLVGAQMDRHKVVTFAFELPIDSQSRDERGTNLRLDFHYLF